MDRTTPGPRGYVGHPELPDGYDPYLPGRRIRDDDWMARAALAAGVIGLFPVAIVLGHLSVRSARAGRARETSRAPLALGLGYMAALIAAASLASLLVLGGGDLAGGATLAG